jgi:hypothetical protein
VGHVGPTSVGGLVFHCLSGHMSDCNVALFLHQLCSQCHLKLGFIAETSHSLPCSNGVSEGAKKMPSAEELKEIPHYYENARNLSLLP